MQVELASGQGSLRFKGPGALVNTFPFGFPGCGFSARRKVSVHGGVKGRSEAAAALFGLVYRLKEQTDKEQQQLAQEPRESTSELGSAQMEFLQRLNEKKKSVCVCVEKVTGIIVFGSILFILDCGGEA